MQLLEGEKTPETLLPRTTPPVGFTSVPVSVSVTVAVHVVGVFTTTADGEQDKLTKLALRMAFTEKMFQLLE